MARHNYYNVLGIPKGASPVDIKKAYRALARKWHPDSAAGSPTHTQQFKDITEAYRTLSNPALRTRYDQLGLLYTEDGRPPLPEDIQGALQNVIDGFRSRFAPKKQKNADIRAHIEVSLESVFSKQTGRITVHRQLPCGLCEGTRADPSTGMEPCGACTGTGKSHLARWLPTPCYHCSGTGTQPIKACEACQSSGVNTETSEVSFAIPPGITHGTELRIQGMGHATHHKHPGGDLIVEVAIKHHPFFRRKGRDVILKLPVTIAELALGTTLTVPTLDRSRVLTVPPNTANGTKFRFAKQGLTPSEGTNRGDFFVQMEVEIPEGLDKTTSTKLKQVVEAFPENAHPNRKRLSDWVKDNR